MELLDYDGCSEILVSSIEDAAAFFSSPEYVEKMNSKSMAGSRLAQMAHGPQILTVAYR
jgi:hypothetical protein